MSSPLFHRLWARLARSTAPLVLVGLLGAPAAQAAGDAQPIVCPPPAPPLTADGLQQGLRTARDRGLLWRLEKDGRSSWLYGTLHLARADWAAPGPRVQGALRESDVVALELDPLDAATQKVLAEPADPAIARRVIDARRGERLARQLARACLPAGALDSQRPALRGVALVMLAARGEALYGDFAADLMIAGLASGLGKPVRALENARDQLALLAGRDDAEEGELLDDALDELESDSTPGLTLRLAQAWAAGDLATLESYPDWCHCMDSAAERAQMKRLLDDRNGPMADQVAALHAGGQRVFAAVGALHMIGPQGLPALLRARGFRVERRPWTR